MHKHIFRATRSLQLRRDTSDPIVVRIQLPSATQISLILIFQAGLWNMFLPIDSAKLAGQADHQPVRMLCLTCTRSSTAFGFPLH